MRWWSGGETKWEGWSSHDILRNNQRPFVTVRSEVLYVHKMLWVSPISSGWVTDILVWFGYRRGMRGIPTHTRGMLGMALPKYLGTPRIWLCRATRVWRVRIFRNIRVRVLCRVYVRGVCYVQGIGALEILGYEKTAYLPDTRARRVCHASNTRVFWVCPPQDTKYPGMSGMAYPKYPGTTGMPFEKPEVGGGTPFAVPSVPPTVSVIPSNSTLSSRNATRCSRYVCGDARM